MKEPIYLGHVQEKLELSVEWLAVSSDSIQRKIDNIFQSHLLSLETILERVNLQNFLKKINKKLKESNNLTFEEMMTLIKENNRGYTISMLQAERVSRTIHNMLYYSSRIKG